MFESFLISSFFKCFLRTPQPHSGWPFTLCRQHSYQYQQFVSHLSVIDVSYFGSKIHQIDPSKWNLLKKIPRGGLPAPQNSLQNSVGNTDVADSCKRCWRWEAVSEWFVLIIEPPVCMCEWDATWRACLRVLYFRFTAPVVQDPQVEPALWLRVLFVSFVCDVG